MEKLGITGCGWLGEKIADAAVKEFEIHCTTTSEDKLSGLRFKNYHPNLVQFPDDSSADYENIFSEMDVILITVPFSQRTPLNILKQRYKNIISFIGDFKGKLYLCSSTGVYPATDEIITENSVSYEQLNENISCIEKLMKNTFPQLNVLRFGGLMGADRIFSNYYKNKEIAEPNQYVNHSHYEDIAAVFLKLIKTEINGETLNVVSPEHPTKAEVYNCQTKGLCELIKGEKSGKRISSKKMTDLLNYKFIHPDPAKF